MKTLIFEGAGWDNAASNGVGNCRIRTRIQNDKGEIVYLEINGFEETKYTKRPFPFTGYVMHCFTRDDNESSPFRECENEKFEYTVTSLIEWVNRKLNCSFDALSVINDGSVQVHETDKPLCTSLAVQIAA